MKTQYKSLAVLFDVTLHICAYYIYVLLSVHTPVQYALGVRVHTLTNVFTSQMTGVSDLC